MACARGLASILRAQIPRLEGDQWVQLTSRDAELYCEAVETGHLMKIRAAACTAGTSAKMRRIRGIVEDAAGTDGGEVNEQLLFDESVPMEQRLVEVERQRLRGAG